MTPAMTAVIDSEIGKSILCLFYKDLSCFLKFSPVHFVFRIGLSNLQL